MNLFNSLYLTFVLHVYKFSVRAGAVCWVSI